jgi:hypothetical protein
VRSFNLEFLRRSVDLDAFTHEACYIRGGLVLRASLERLARWALCVHLKLSYLLRLYGLDSVAKWLRFTPEVRLPPIWRDECSMSAALVFFCAFFAKPGSVMESWSIQRSMPHLESSLLLSCEFKDHQATSTEP